MKILYISCSNSVGGSSVALLNILKGMKLKGHSVLVVTPLDPGPLLNWFDSENIEYIKTDIQLNVWRNTSNPLKLFKFIIAILFHQRRTVKRLLDIIQSFKPDIVHTNVGPLDVGIRAARKVNIPHVWHQREYQDLDFGLKFFPNIRTFYMLSRDPNNYNICISQDIFDYRRMRDNKDCVICDGVFSYEQTLLKVDDSKSDYVLFAGRVEEAKGVYDAIVVFSEFRKKYKECKFLIAGSFSESSVYYKKCKSYIIDNELSDSVEFLGVRNDIYKLMAHAKMLVVPSRYEGFGFITAEAMLNNCVVVGRNTAGTKYQFDVGLNYTGMEIGYRFNNNEQMLDAMIKAMSTDNKDMINCARKTVVNKYTLENNVEQVEKYYYKILEQYGN